MQSGKPTELHWIENNFEKIQSTIKRYNQNNKIMFIANEGVKSDIIKIYCVIPDPNDTVARKPFTKNKLLYDYFSNIDNEQKSNNLKHYKAKMHKRNTLFQKFKVKMKNIYNKIFSQEYIHTQIYNENCQ